ncbi:hypothetical protein [Sphingomonas aracearum]|uniref:Uncharacterized protein n=1 Tax=Sphingomonas aracearum TaxID=2283317 RepID=A0A369VX16_9SPHN|nr:hypothetical protein [Sphingomonas aracearum]RDE06673.1 hypothetical protein DVW87_02945 [Sphingomonas aracearum]
MKKFLAAAAVTLSLLAPVAVYARTAEKQSFKHEGQTYVYTVTDKQGATVYQGRRFPSGSAFRLVRRGDYVTGRSGGTPVAFRVESARGTAAITVAAR